MYLKLKRWIIYTKLLGRGDQKRGEEFKKKLSLAFEYMGITFSCDDFIGEKRQ